jgi:hypothetical protein
MRAEEILKFNDKKVILNTFKIMITIKIKERNFYEAIHIIDRLNHYQISLDEIY